MNLNLGLDVQLLLQCTNKCATVLKSSVNAEAAIRIHCPVVDQVYLIHGSSQVAPNKFSPRQVALLSPALVRSYH